MVLNYEKCFIALVLATILVMNCSLPAVSAAANPSGTHYKGHNIVWNKGNGYLYYSKNNVGFLWMYTDHYYKTNSYYRCVTYYHDSWIANNGQKLAITQTVVKSRSVTDTVSAEIGVNKVVSANVGTAMTTSATTQYSTALALTYDLSKASRSSYKIASMGYIEKFVVKRYKTSSNKFNSQKVVYSYDTNFGDTITLVYRY